MPADLDTQPEPAVDPSPDAAAPAAGPAADGAAILAAAGAVVASPSGAAAAAEAAAMAQPAASVLSTVAALPAAPAPSAARPEPSLAQTAATLAERFPALFTPGQARPIKLRIQGDIQQRAPGQFTRKQLSIFLHRHTTSTAYLKALVASPQRFDLDGNPAGEVAAEHRDAAGAELERRRQIVMERQRAGRAQHGAGLPGGSAPPAAVGEGATPAAEHERPPQPERAARAEAERPAGRRGERAPDHRPERHGRAPDRRVGPQPERSPRRGPESGATATSAVTRPGRPPAPAAPPAASAPKVDPLPDDPARRERALLLRAWESSPLTPANFCALKALKVAEFEAQIELARRERAERRG